MTAITEAPESLDWVTFSEERDETCDGRHGADCSNEAVAWAFWAVSCTCVSEKRRVCAPHRDEYLAEIAERGSSRYRCFVCCAPAWLLGIEPIR